MKRPANHAIMAQRYSGWAREQIERAKRTLNPKARNDRLALAAYYSQLAERELAAVERLKSAATIFAAAAEPEEIVPAIQFTPAADHIGSV